MPVDSTHPEYDVWSDKWQRMRDVIAGEDAVKAAGATYLMMLGGQDREEYQNYKMRAEFYEATGRTLDGLVGAVFRKPPAIDVPDATEPMIDNVTQRGAPLQVFAKQVVREVLSVGRYGVLVDVPQSGGQPYQIGYPAEAVVNWRTDIIDGRPKLVLVVLREESRKPKSDDRYESEAVEQFRVLELIEGFYVQTLWEKSREGTREEFVQVGEPIMPQRTGQKLDFLPFQFFGSQDLGWTVQKPPLLGLANANLSHYRDSADMQHGAHWTALPTPWVAGGAADNTTGPLKIGSTTAWLLAENAKVGMLEHSGAGLESLGALLDRKEKHMAVLGARLLESQRADAESHATVALRHQGENSLLASIADTVGRGLTITTNWQLWWAGGGEQDATVELNKDFVERALSPQEMVQLVAGWQQGGYGGEVLFHNLVEGERVPEGWTLDDWRKDLEENGPAAMFMGREPDEDEDEPPEDEV